LEGGVYPASTINFLSNEDTSQFTAGYLHADIEHDKGILTFYEKNGFIPNGELYNKNRKTISMRKDLYQ